MLGNQIATQLTNALQRKARQRSISATQIQINLKLRGLSVVRQELVARKKRFVLDLEKLDESAKNALLRT